MAIIIVKPTDESATDYDAKLALYESQLDGALLLMSPDLTVHITSDDIPYAVIGADVYLRRCELKVLKDTGQTAADVAALARDSEEYLSLVLLTQIQLAIRAVVQVPQLIEDRLIQESKRYRETDLEDHQDNLKSDYKDALAESPLTPASTPSGIGDATVALTKSRALDD